MKKYQPKGGMCAVCAKVLKNCSELKFDEMPIIGINAIGSDPILIVRCTEFKRKSG